MDYFYFHFIEKEEFVQREYANTLFMHRFHKSCNKYEYRQIFQDKSKFLQKFKQYVNHRFFLLRDHSFVEFRDWLLSFQPSHIMVKKLEGTGGFGVRKVDLDYGEQKIFEKDTQKPIEELLNYFIKNKFYLIEEFIEQHETLDTWNSSCINTLRIITYLDKSHILHFIGALLRIGVNGEVDNFHSGGLAVLIDINSGRTKGKGFRMDPSANEFYKKHPVTGVELSGLDIPYWKEIITLVTKASLVVPQIRTVGWDIAITPNGPELIEGNDNWDKIIIEKALGKGIKSHLKSLEDV